MRWISWSYSIFNRKITHLGSCFGWCQMPLIWFREIVLIWLSKHLCVPVLKLLELFLILITHCKGYIVVVIIVVIVILLLPFFQAFEFGLTRLPLFAKYEVCNLGNWMELFILKWLVFHYWCLSRRLDRDVMSIKEVKSFSGRLERIYKVV